MLKPDLEKLNKSELITLLIEHEENRCEEKEEMRVGDIIILKKPIKQMGMSKYHEIFQINAQHGDMAFVTKLKCVRKYPCHNIHEDGNDKYVNFIVMITHVGNIKTLCTKSTKNLMKIRYTKYDYNSYIMVVKVTFLITNVWIIYDEIIWIIDYI